MLALFGTEERADMPMICCRIAMTAMASEAEHIGIVMKCRFPGCEDFDGSFLACFAARQ